MPHEDATAFRQSLGAFATGVTIVTAVDPSGAPVGMTASSFNSVSMDPPLVLWSLAKKAHSHEVFTKSGQFAIHVLGAHQDDLSNRFAKSGTDKFVGLELGEGVTGVPILPDYAALFECETHHLYDGGDHVILVGRVVRHEQREVAPLVFHGGRYAETRERLLEGAGGKVGTVDPSSFREDFLSYLLPRANMLFGRAILPSLQENGLTEADNAVLGRLALTGPLSMKALLTNLEGSFGGLGKTHVEAMADRGLLKGLPDAIRLTDDGEDLFLEVLSITKALEEHIESHFDDDEVATLKNLLRRLIDAGGGSIPQAWRRDG